MFQHRKRECRCGAGEEATADKCDTPGFDNISTPQVVVEKKILKLKMDRNHSRINQTSLDMLKSWRGNCDIQILIYKSDPDKPIIVDVEIAINLSDSDSDPDPNPDFDQTNSPIILLQINGMTG